MEKILNKAVKITDRLNESTIEVKAEDYKDICGRLSEDLHAMLRRDVCDR